MTVGGYLQPQLLLQSFNAAASPNRVSGNLPAGISANDTTAKADGTTTNGNMFRLRRTRLRVAFETDVMRAFLQIDVLPNGGAAPGIGTIARNAEVTGKIHWTRDVRTEVTMGLFQMLARYELVEALMVRPFIERTWFSQNAFPTERDIGVHAKTIALKEKLTADIGVVNGQTLGQPTFVLEPDLNKAKNVVGWFAYDFGPVTVGVNPYFGRGQVVDGASLRFKQFTQWSGNAMAIVKLPIFKKLGESRLYSELTFTQNMDTGIKYAFAVPAIPANFASDVTNLHGRAFYARLEQDVTRWFLAGYRFDTYTPDSSIKDNARDTHALLAVARFSPNLRFMNEVGLAFDNVHPRGQGAPGRNSLYFSSVLQATF